jgi:hypothetical protein
MFSQCTRQPRTTSVGLCCRAASTVRWRGLCLHQYVFGLFDFPKPVLTNLRFRRIFCKAFGRENSSPARQVTVYLWPIACASVACVCIYILLGFLVFFNLVLPDLLHWCVASVPFRCAHICQGRQVPIHI